MGIESKESRRLEHHMLLDAKQVEDLGLFDYLMRAFRAKTEEEVEKICDELEADLASCDVSKDYVSVERLAMTAKGGK